jgi:hypothetical protein
LNIKFPVSVQHRPADVLLNYEALIVGSVALNEFLYLLITVHDLEVVEVSLALCVLYYPVLDFLPGRIGIWLLSERVVAFGELKPRWTADLVDVEGAREVNVVVATMGVIAGHEKGEGDAAGQVFAVGEVIVEADELHILRVGYSIIPCPRCLSLKMMALLHSLGPHQVDSLCLGSLVVNFPPPALPEDVLDHPIVVSPLDVVAQVLLGIALHLLVLHAVAAAQLPDQLQVSR